MKSLVEKGKAMTFKLTGPGPGYRSCWLHPSPRLSPARTADNGNSREYFLTATIAEVASCLEAGSDVAAQTENGRTPLHFAAWNSKNPVVVKTLLEAGAKPDALSKNGNTALILAAWGTVSASVGSVA